MILRRARAARDGLRDAYFDQAYRSGFVAGLQQGHQDERDAFVQRLEDLRDGYTRIGMKLSLAEALNIIHE
jgi:hypothetical protein